MAVLLTKELVQACYIGCYLRQSLFKICSYELKEKAKEFYMSLVLM